MDVSNIEALEAPSLKIAETAPTITIQLPASYESSKAKRYPVLYLLDGESNDELVKGMLHRLHLSQGSNEHIIVGITSTNRLRDFAPTVNRDPRGPVGEGGGGDKFLDFIAFELIPAIDKKYRTNDHNVIAGHSVAGLLVIHSFHSRPDLFQAHLAFSPAVWWGKRETLEAAQHYVMSGDDVASYLYMNIGNEDGELREVYDAFAQTMSRNRSTDLVLQLEKFEHTGHDFTLAAGLYNALTGLYKYQQRANR